MSGYFAGGAEYVEVEQSFQGFTPSVIRANSCQSAYIAGNATAFFAGLPGTGSVANFYGSQYAVSSVGPEEPEVRMAPVGEAMCYLTRVGGEFDGGGEFVAVYPKKHSDGKEYWFLKATAGSSCSGFGCAKKPIHGRSRCYSRNQL